MHSSETHAIAADPESEPASALQEAVWLALDLGIDMPPVPAKFAPRLATVTPGLVFATAPELVACQSPAAIAAALEGGWPRPGLAFGLLPVGTGGRWFYTLASEREMLHISVRLSFRTGPESEGTAAQASRAHAMLERHLADPAAAARALSDQPGLEGEPRRVVVFSDEGEAWLTERHASFTGGGGLSNFVERSLYFTETPQAEDSRDTLIFA
ncbi:hypothetical protein NK718_13435 [Alsobacter sp. SYSU M60028]|uniref:Uncharacterized protein n=1 Tax=Alsobacter ponti TaxID=2962936 RepID=A0ABT1LEJ5_9HYPH|nr:hypothetical protein [Alsobacter ponti]MCP8939523.1 hypothetical protein [Alsobacter ponti]